MKEQLMDHNKVHQKYLLHPVRFESLNLNLDFPECGLFVMLTPTSKNSGGKPQQNWGSEAPGSSILSCAPGQFMFVRCVLGSKSSHRQKK